MNPLIQAFFFWNAYLSAISSQTIWSFSCYYQMFLPIKQFSYSILYQWRCFVGFYLFQLICFSENVKRKISSYDFLRILNASYLLDNFLNVSIQWILMNFDHQMYFLNERLDKSSIGKHANIFSETAICMQVTYWCKLNQISYQCFF